MLIESIAVDQLLPAPYNPRVPLKPGDVAYEKLRRSLREFDLVQPIVWNRQTGHVVGGHQRLEVLKQEGVTTVECVVVEMDLAREKGLNIALNNQELASDWDSEKLQRLVDELCSLPDFDPSLTGFDSQQLRDLLFIPDDKRVDRVDVSNCDSNFVSAQLDIPLPCWEAVRPHLDALLAAEPTVKLHVQLPPDCTA